MIAGPIGQTISLPMRRFGLPVKFTAWRNWPNNSSDGGGLDWMLWDEFNPGTILYSLFFFLLLQEEMVHSLERNTAQCSV